MPQLSLALSADDFSPLGRREGSSGQVVFLLVSPIVFRGPKFGVVNLGFRYAYGKKMVQLQQFTLSRHLNQSFKLRTF